MQGFFLGRRLFASGLSEDKFDAGAPEKLLSHHDSCSASIWWALGEASTRRWHFGNCYLSKFYLKKAELSSEGLAKFPPTLKRKLAVLQWSVIGLLLVIISFGVAVKTGLV